MSNRSKQGFGNGSQNFKYQLGFEIFLNRTDTFIWHINCQALGGALAYLYTVSTVSLSSDSGLLEYTVSDTKNVWNYQKKEEV